MTTQNVKVATWDETQDRIVMEGPAANRIVDAQLGEGDRVEAEESIGVYLRLLMAAAIVARKMEDALEDKTRRQYFRDQTTFIFETILENIEEVEIQ